MPKPVSKPSKLEKFSKFSNRRFQKRVRAFYRGKVLLSQDESTRYLAGEDPDLVTVTQFLDNELDATEDAAVRERFRTDEHFARVYLPLVELRHRTRDPRYQSVLEHSTVRRKWKRQSRIGGTLLLAILVLVIGGVLKELVGRHFRDRAIAAQIATGVAPASVISGQVYSTTDRDTALSFMGADLELRPHTIYTANTVRSGGGWMALDGEAAIHSWGATLNVYTATSMFNFAAGRYAIRSIPHSGETRIVVDSGWVRVVRLPDLTLMATLDSGERAIVHPGGHVTVTNERGGFPLSAFAPPAGTRQNDTTSDVAGLRRSSRRVMAAIKASGK